MATHPLLYRFTSDDFVRLAEAGALRHEGRLELVDGVIVALPAPNPPHASTVDALTAAFAPLIGQGVVIRVQGPVKLGEHDTPMPT